MSYRHLRLNKPKDESQSQYLQNKVQTFDIAYKPFHIYLLPSQKHSPQMPWGSTLILLLFHTFPPLNNFFLGLAVSAKGSQISISNPDFSLLISKLTLHSATWISDRYLKFNICKIMNFYPTPSFLSQL